MSELGELQRMVDKKLDECSDKILEVYNHKISRPYVSYSLSGIRILGKAVYMEHMIKLNKDYLLKHKKEFINTTVVHEFAHLAAHYIYGKYIRPHGREWKEIMHMLDATPNRCSNLETPKELIETKKPWIYKCSCQKFHISNLIHNKMKKGQKRWCKKCKGDLIFIGHI